MKMYQKSIQEIEEVYSRPAAKRKPGDIGEAVRGAGVTLEGIIEEFVDAGLGTKEAVEVIVKGGDTFASDEIFQACSDALIKMEGAGVSRKGLEIIRNALN